MRASVGDIVEAGGSEFAGELLAESCAIARANGRAPDDATAERFKRMFTLPGSSLTASLFRDMEDGKAIEAEAIVGELIRMRGSVGTPMLDVAYLHMKAYLSRRKRTQGA
jgi:2-dehydropantoate 2-reductase